MRLLAQSDGEPAALLAGCGYDAARPAEGRALQIAAQAAFTGRQRAAALDARLRRFCSTC